MGLAVREQRLHEEPHPIGAEVAGEFVVGLAAPGRRRRLGRSRRGEQAVDLADEIRRGDRPTNVGLHAGIARLRADRLALACRERDDPRARLQARAALDRGRGGMPVKPGHVEVHQHEVVGPRVDGGQRGRAVADTVDVVGRRRKHGLRQDPVQLDVVDNEDATALRRD